MLKAQLELEKFRWLLIMLVPLLAISLNFIMFGPSYVTHPKILIFSTLILLTATALLSGTHIFIANYIRKKLTAENRVIARMLIAACIHFPLTAIFITGYFLFYDSISLFGYSFSVSELKWGLLAGIICDVIGIAMNEGIYSYHRWKATKLEAEQLSKEKLQTQLNSLLQQINPHFLFNSLNTLSALINESPGDAQKYLSDLSRVYRYLLRTNENELTTLTNELHFIDSYFNLLETRFGKGVSLEKNIHPDMLCMSLPPLTLQLLVENAVKHNIVRKSTPLRIEINADGGFVYVKNNLQLKSLKVESTKVGLSNISEKYRLINKSNIEIIADTISFTVKVPLLDAMVV
ncbi:MAG: histidine kinase [Agriterribacter sp.]